MYRFVLIMWILGRITAEQVQALVDAGRLTEEEGAEIMLLTPPAIDR